MPRVHEGERRMPSRRMRRVVLLWGSLLPVCCLPVAGEGGRWTAGVEPLPDLPARIRVAAAVPELSVSELSEEFSRPIVDGMVARGWSADDVGFAPPDRLLPPLEERRGRRTGREPVPWPGMQVDTEYALVAASGRRHVPWGTVALAAAGLMLLSVRKW